MDCVYIAPLSKALYIYIAPLSKALYNLCLSFTHTFTHPHINGDWLAMQGTNQLIRSNRGLGVLLRETSTRPGWDRTGNPPTARRLLLPPEPHRPWHLRMFKLYFSSTGDRRGQTLTISQRSSIKWFFGATWTAPSARLKTEGRWTSTWASSVRL